MSQARQELRAALAAEHNDPSSPLSLQGGQAVEDDSIVPDEEVDAWLDSVGRVLRRVVPQLPAPLNYLGGMLVDTLVGYAKDADLSIGHL